MKINSVIYTEQFERNIKSVKDSGLKNKAKKQIEKIIKNPETGKPLRYVLKGERTVYVKSFRIIYAIDRDNLIFLRFMHRNDVYRQLCI
ncbi:MAG: type II toxin-antitoxin system RelE/ParE family toxin [Candidatus Aenigmarchaeota archaeon]|nr:type II toxin-antitoxin system RelE/ParE family toxin [Candidatus Aenigmarchaeota archaeon]